MPLLATVLISTARPSYSGTTTGASYAPNLSDVPAHIEPVNPVKYLTFGEAAASSDYVISVDAGTDIADMDRITASVLITDGVTPYPGDFPSNNTNEFWQVSKATEDAPLLLPQRLAFVKRIKGGGPAHK